MGQVRQVFERKTGSDPTPGFPLGDALTHGEPVSHVACSRATPEIAPVDLGDEAEELTLDPRSLPMRSIDRIDEFFVAVCVCWGHPDLVRSRGRRPPLYRTYVRPSTLWARYLSNAVIASPRPRWNTRQTRLAANGVGTFAYFASWILHLEGALASGAFPVASKPVVDRLRCQIQSLRDVVHG